MEESSVLRPTTTTTTTTTAIELQVENPTSIFQFPTPTLEYLADTKQSDIYRSLGMDRRRKNLLVNIVRIVHRKVLSQNISWRDIDPSLKKKAVIQLFAEEEHDEVELVAWLRGFEDNWILHYLFRRRHTTYLDGLRRLEKKKRIRAAAARAKD